MKRRIIIFDFEVFKYDTLLGAIILEDNTSKIFQTWNLPEIAKFYEDNKNSIWVGQNISFYDNLILQEVVYGKSSPRIKRKSDEIINRTKRAYLNIPLIYYDLMSYHMVGLKVVEAAVGKDISILEDVDFNIDRPLTDDEKRKVEMYNIDDLDQTLDNFYNTIQSFTLRLDVINEFKLPITSLSATGTQLAEEVLKAEKIDGIEDWYVAPKMYDNLKVKNQKIIDYYLSETFRKNKPRVPLDIDICGTPHRIASGGIHGAKRKYHAEWAYYFDVSGYYNLVMILYDLLPRSIPNEYVEVYKKMYYDQLELKKINPAKRGVYKVILLSVFGATLNEWCRFYDPNHGSLITMVGQMFLVDLLEKFENKAEIIQSNTDGIIVKAINGTTEEEVKEIITEWQTRTGFTLKLEKIYNIHQRDVNTYMYQTEDGRIQTVGEVGKHYEAWENPFYEATYNAKEPLIMGYGVVDYFMKGVLPEETIEKYKRELRLFQFLCKRNTYKYMTIEKTDSETGETLVKDVPHPSRAFASNSKDIWTIYKHKPGAKAPKAKLQNLAENVFVHNTEILSEKAINEIVPLINYSYYVERSYEKIQEFLNIKQVKKILV